jgi:hypothetical protein
MSGRIFCSVLVVVLCEEGGRWRQRIQLDEPFLRLTGSWQPYVKNFAPNHSFDCGNRAAALWLDR